MKNSTIIDYKILETAGITPLEFLYLVAVFNKEVQNPNIKYHGKIIDLKSLESRLMIKLSKDGQIIIREEAKELIDYLSLPPLPKLNSPKIIKKSKKQVTIEVESRVDEYRLKWGGLKAGVMGGRQDCVAKLVRWILTNPTYTFDQILGAADLYLATEGSNLDYLQRADFFIYKQDIHKNEASRLSAYIDDIQLGVKKDWTTTLK